QPDSYQFLVIGQQHRDRHLASLRGMEARTWNVSERGPGPAWNVPPTCSTRRRIPVIPVPSIGSPTGARVVTCSITASVVWRISTVAQRWVGWLTTLVSDYCRRG